MGFGIPVRNAVALGVGGVVGLATGEASPNPGPPWQALSSGGTTYTVNTIVLSSGGTAYTTVDSVRSSSGTTYFPI